MFAVLLLLMCLGGAAACGCPGTNQVYILHKAPMTGWYTFVPGEGFQLVANLEGEAEIKYNLVYLRTRQVWVIKEIRSPMVNDLFTWNSTSAHGEGVNNVKIYCPGPCTCRKVKVRGERCFRGYYGRTDVVEQLKEEETTRLEQEALAKAMSLTKGFSLITPSPRQLPPTVVNGEDALVSLFRQMNGKDKNKNPPKLRIQSPSTTTRKSLSRVKRFSVPGQRGRDQRANMDYLQGLLGGQFNLEHDGLQNGREKGWQDEHQIGQVDNSLDEPDGDHDMFDILLNDQHDDQLNSGQKGEPINSWQDVQVTNRQVNMLNDRQSDVLNGQVYMLNSRQVDMLNGRQADILNGRQADMLNVRQADMLKGRQADMLNGRQVDMLNVRQTDMLNGRQADMLNVRQADMLSGQPIDLLHSHVDLPNTRQVDMLNSQQADTLHGSQIEMLNDRQTDLPNNRQYHMLNSWQGSRQEDQRDARQNERKTAAPNDQEDDPLTRLLFAQSQVRQRDSFPLLSSKLPKKPAPKNIILQETLDMLNKLLECVLSPPETFSSTTEKPTKSCASGTHPVSAKVKSKPLPNRSDTGRTRRNYNLTMLQSFNNLHIDGQDSEIDEEETVKCQPDVYAYMGNAEYRIARTETGHFWWIGMGNDLFAVSDEGGPCVDQLPANTKWMTAVDRNAVKSNENVTVQCVDWDPS
ncbi:uncharacterized protein LOC125028994 isoform X2 [Penaeus chinensis]|nr:uncharacterized protein LOC125028994 isoform X2 [Penaeus chinensis]